MPFISSFTGTSLKEFKDPEEPQTSQREPFLNPDPIRTRIHNNAFMYFLLTVQFGAIMNKRTQIKEMLFVYL
jgi:hypothetical protein